MRKLFGLCHPSDNQPQFLSLSALIFKHFTFNRNHHLTSLVMENALKDTQVPNEHCAQWQHSFYMRHGHFFFIGSQTLVWQVLHPSIGL